MLAQADATNARILFLLLGIPGVLAAGALGIAAGWALAEANRREEACCGCGAPRVGRSFASLRPTRLSWVCADRSLDSLVAAVTVSLVTGGPVWRGVAAGELATTRSWRLPSAPSPRSSGCCGSEGQDAGQKSPSSAICWSGGGRRCGNGPILDLILIALGLTVLGINRLAGGLSQTPIEGTSLALSFYVLLAPIFLWLGVTFLAVRVVLAILSRRARAGAAGAVAFVARSCHPMDRPPSGTHGRGAHARGVGGGVRHPGAGVRRNLSHRESD